MENGSIDPSVETEKIANEGQSFRPIFLLSAVAEIIEALLLSLPINQKPAARHLRGFRKMYRTTTVLPAIVILFSQSLNQQMTNERTILVALDLSKAFETLSHVTLF